jgi:transcriptional regulator with XRE-family HTH domain
MYLNIKLQILRLGIHQNNIARALGINESVLSKIIHGYREPSKTHREQLAAFLKAEESWLFENYDRALPDSVALPSLPTREDKEGIL